VAATTAATTNSSLMENNELYCATKTLDSGSNYSSNNQQLTAGEYRAQLRNNNTVL
jgi:hypothetical protein